MTRVLVDVPVYEPGLKRLAGLPGVEVEVCDPISEKRMPRKTSLISDREILFCGAPPENLDDMIELKWIQIASSGFESLIPLNLPKRGIRASNARGVFDTPIAEWCLAMMVNLTRDLPQLYRNQQAGHWDRDARFQTEIRGRTVGFWGYGGLARETARLAKTLGLRVHALTRNGARPQVNLYRVEGTGDPEGQLPDAVFTMEGKREFLESLDFLVMGLPLNDRTRGMVTAEDLKTLRPSAYVLNPARGPLIREEALLQALREGWIAGAALDTHYHYPMPPDHPLWSFPNVIMTPHISGSTKSNSFPERVWDLFVQNVSRYLVEEPLLNLLDPIALSPEGGST
ncbi:MAG: D-2-hydroxyacid dehydrogenase [Candidatus Omnitrophica bacterium]|nr:D-2-hydroxyacid dehydrogenase [Candidatus Omnitrophota bacterium]